MNQRVGKTSLRLVVINQTKDDKLAYKYYLTIICWTSYPNATLDKLNKLWQYLLIDKHIWYYMILLSLNGYADSIILLVYWQCYVNEAAPSEYKYIKKKYS